MDIKDIIALSHAGFTRDQIVALAQAQNATPAEPAAPVTPATPAEPVAPVTPATPAEPAAPVTPATPAEPVAPVTPTSVPANFGAFATPVHGDPVLEQLRILTNAVQANGIINSNQPAPRTADDILAEIINPPTFIKEG